MEIQSIRAAYHHPTPASASATAENKTSKKVGDASEINRLNAEIEEAEADVKETMKEVQKAVAESVGGESDKAQLLQNKIALQQQAITMKQMQVKEIGAPEKQAVKQTSVDSIRSRFDQFIEDKNHEKEPDNVYHLEEENGNRKIIFSRPSPSIDKIWD